MDYKYTKKLQNNHFILKWNEPEINSFFLLVLQIPSTENTFPQFYFPSCRVPNVGFGQSCLVLALVHLIKHLKNPIL